MAEGEGTHIILYFSKVCFKYFSLFLETDNLGKPHIMIATNQRKNMTHELLSNKLKYVEKV